MKTHPLDELFSGSKGLDSSLLHCIAVEPPSVSSLSFFLLLAVNSLTLQLIVVKRFSCLNIFKTNKKLFFKCALLQFCSAIFFRLIKLANYMKIDNICGKHLYVFVIYFQWLPGIDVLVVLVLVILVVIIVTVVIVEVVSKVSRGARMAARIITLSLMCLDVW